MPDGNLQARPAFANATARRRKVLIADLFCGAGGSSTGAIKALRRLGLDPVLTCVNHWPLAIETHRKNHPEARHYCMDVESVKPEDVVPEGRLDLLMASPTCTYHSRARGGRPTSDQQRMDPWHVVRWLTSLRVKRLLVENVPEFVDWGPVDARTGKPIKARRGEYFNAWLAALAAVGMRVDWRIVNCADHGDATTRKRFILIGRSDGRRMSRGSPGATPEVEIERGAFGLPWPAASHAPKATATARGLKPWRAAREIIDWDLEGQSIFTRARPLAPNTIRRIAAGIVKYGGDAAAGFLVVLRRHADARGLDLPLPTVTANGTHMGLAKLTLEPFIAGCGGRAAQTQERGVSEPLYTITGKNDRGVVEPFVLGQQSCASPRGVGHPLPTVAAAGAISLTEPVIVNMKGRSNASSSSEPLPTVTAHARHFSVAEGSVTPFLATVNHGAKPGEGGRVRDVDDPMATVTGTRGDGLAEPFVTPYYGSGSGETGKTVAAPLDTITAKARLGLAEPFIVPQFSSGKPKKTGDPLGTLTTTSRGVGLAEPFIVPQFGEAPGQAPRTHDVRDPLPTVTSHGAGAVAEGVIDPVVGIADGIEDLAPGDPRIVVVDGVPLVFDIRFRMLTNGELARAMGFSDDEVDYEFVGNKAQVTRQIGNAVPVNTAAALVSALFAPGKGKGVRL